MRPDRARHGARRAPFVALLASLAAVSLVAGAGSGVGAVAGERASVSVSATGSPSEPATDEPTEEPTGEPTEEPTGEPTEEPTGEPTGGPVEVDDAVLAWGMSNESSNRAHAPGTYNFFSAGRAPDLGGGTTLSAQQWRARSGQVSVEKWDGTRWRSATWRGLSTTSDGQPLGAPAAGTFSNHRFVVRGGTGTVDAIAGTAEIQWRGTVSVLYYSGMSLYFLTDPRLEVADGEGRLTTSVSGYASSVVDPSSWVPVPARRVTVADLGAVPLADPAGFLAEPRYRGVRVNGVSQVREGAHWGSFPQSFIDYLDRLGVAAFWYSSGSSTDPFKVALPVSVGFGGAGPPQPTPSAPTSTAPAIDNPVVTAPPDAPAGPGVPAGPAPAGPPVPGTPSAPGVPPAMPPGLLSATSATALQPAAAATSVTDPAGGRPLLWWSGALLLLAAALLTAFPTPAPRPRGHQAST